MVEDEHGRGWEGMGGPQGIGSVGVGDRFRMESGQMREITSVLDEMREGSAGNGSTKNTAAIRQRSRSNGIGIFCRN